MRHITEFKENDRVVDHFLCKQKQSLKTRTGKTYLSLKLQDKTGTIDAKVWELNNDIQSFEDKDFIKIDGVVLTYQNDLQLKINKIRRSNPGEYDPADYIPRTEKDVADLYQTLKDFIKSINNYYIRQLMENILIHNEEIASAFQSHSAAKNMHHSFMGGLIEHTTSVTQICDFLSTRYKHVNRDLLISTAMLHDLGKVFELSPFPDNDYTDEGQLVGHIVMCSELISNEAAKIPDFPPRLKTLLQHSILAHHGELEFGSPKQPKTIEAFILHCADNVDAKAKMFEESLSENEGKGNWLGFVKTLSRNVTFSDF
jgi:3'-5' exoribonuclease